MECNKEEAIKAMKLAEKKIQEHDFVGAQKFAQKAQRLYPDVENISRLLTVCEVHCSSLVKIGGTEMDWYRILQIEQTVDEAAIKKQYRKLALLLHPDKNKFAGAEAAFKLICEANRVLSDQAKRAPYDRKYRDLVRNGMRKPSKPQTNGDSYVRSQYGAASNFQSFPRPQNTGCYPNQQAKEQTQTFWTCCPFCNVRYQYYRACLNVLLVCQTCQKSYIAHDFGTPVVPPGSFQTFFSNKKEVPNQGPSKVPSQVNKGNSSRKRSSNMSKGWQPMSEEGNATKLSGDFKMEEKDNGDVQAKKQDVETPQSGTVKSEKAGSSKNLNKKRRRNSVVESSDSEDTEVEDVVIEENVGVSSKLNEGHRPRRSTRQKQNVSYQENLSDDDDFVSPPKWSRVSKSSTEGEKEIEKDIVNVETAKNEFTAGSGTPIKRHKKEPGKKSSFSLEKNLPSEKCNTHDCNVKGKEAEMSDHHEEKSTADNGSELKSNEWSDPESFQYPDPEFSDFDKDRAESCFAADQTWAIYDSDDGMPRYYAFIRRVFYPGFKLKITWLEANPDNQDELDWCDEELPVACGKYKLGATEMADRGMFSHQMHCNKGGSRNTYLVYPRKGETWAIFKNWHINWSSDPKKHRPFEFQYVEVLSDFVEDAGVKVAYLGRVKGFVSLFQRSAQDGDVSIQFLPDQMYIFSHRIPSFRMTGEERKGVPKGSFEFDPVSLPPSFFECYDHDGAKMDEERSDAKTNGLCPPNTQKSEAERVSGFEEISVSGKHENKNSKKETPMPRRSPRKLNSNGHIGGSQGAAIDSEKHDRNHGNLTPSKRSASWTDEKFNTPKKQDEKINTPKKQESNHEAEAFKLRRSPRDVSKNRSAANGSQFTKEEAFTKQMRSEKVENTGCSSHIKPNNCSGTGAAKTHSSAKKQFAKSPARSFAAKAPGTPSSKLSQAEGFDFTQLKSNEKFKLDQIWAMRTNGDLFPKTYGQVRKIESTPEFRVYVALLDPSSSPKDGAQPVCCGIFRVKHEKAKVFPLSSFSHCVSAKPVDKKKFVIYPRKGEIWALYKNQNTDLTCPNPSTGECDIVEVLEDHDESTEVVILSRFGRSESIFRAPRIQRSKAGVVEIPRAETARFSHQIPAFRHTGENDSRLAGCWELDPLSTPGSVICLD